MNTSPFNPAPRDIGNFAIGIGAIGTPPFEWQKTIISQYANSPRILSIIEQFSDALNMARSFDDFYDNVWNVQTAVGYGLDLWGRIVVIGRTLNLQTKFFGFEEGGADYQPFNQAPFYDGLALTSNFVLSDSAYRQLIMAKAAANIWDGSIPGLNRILQLLFPNQVVYCTDNGNMSMTYTFGFALNEVQNAIVKSGVLPRPCGVSVEIIQIS